MSKEIRAMMPGIVLQILVGPGDTFAGGQTLGLIESMKMEMPIEAELAGKVESVHVAKGEAIEEGGLILTYS
jgi:acetyl-CoA carboxylase biotin carboxyl carrier protein